MSRGKHSRTKRRTYWPAVLLLAVVIAAAAFWGVPKLMEPETEPVSSQEPLPADPAEPSEPEEPSIPEPAPEPDPVLPPEPDPAAELLAGMTLREKICQMFVVYPSAITGVSKVTSAGEGTRQALEEWPVGGLLYDRSNMVDQEQVREMLANTQSYSKIPLILTCDEEGGRVNRLMDTIGTTKIGPMLSYKDQGPEKAAENARTIASDLISCGRSWWRRRWRASTRAARPVPSNTFPDTGIPRRTATTAPSTSTRPWRNCARGSSCPSRRASTPGPMP